MVNCEIYIKVNDEFERIDLFKDEKISLTSSVQNINDLSKTFTDYTQSFTIPASKINNQIFNYWNENAVDNGFDQRIRYDAIIEINTIPFRRGKIQIEKANEKNNRVESYSITFYGNTKQIKDLFKEDKLSVLDYTDLNHSYTATEVKNRIENNTYDVCYPLIGNQNKYEFLTGGTNDVSVGGTIEKSIVWNDLFPAISLSIVFEKIQSHYEIDFQGVFFSTTYFDKLFLYCKNIEKTDVYTAPVKVDFTSVTPSPFTEIDFTNDTYKFKWTQDNGTTPTTYQSVQLEITPTNSTITYRVKAKRPDGTIYNVYDNLLGTQVLQIYNGSDTTFTETLYFEVESLSVLTFVGKLYSTKAQKVGVVTSFQSHIVFGATQSTTSIIDIGSNVPDIKIIDFFTGIIKMFNLTITPVDETTFEIEPLEFFYSYGDFMDINNYVINDNVDIDRTKLFKKLSFAHEKSENVLNNYFRNTFNRGYDYGDLLYENPLSNESNTYEIKTPFEDVMWERSTLGNFQTTSLIDKDLKPYKPKVILMYQNNVQSVTSPIKFFNGSTYQNINSYLRFSNELDVNGQIASLNFGEEQSSWNLSALASLSLFQNWYRNYIEQLYNIKARIVKLKAIFPITKLTDIKLNDKLIYKDKKYIINQFTTDLTTGEVDLELITDFRDINDYFTNQKTFNISGNSQNVEVIVMKLNSEYYNVSYGGTSFDNNTENGVFIMPIDSNETEGIVLKQIEIDYFNPTFKKYINIYQDA
jgi:hypothetical protein